MRRLILAETPEEEALALERLFHFQKEDFKEILRAMDGLPVTVRLLDPPLHEFLPPLEALARRAEEGDEEAGRLLRRAEALKEANPMLGFRGARLLLLRPGVFRMQLRALLEAARELKEAGHDPRPEVMVPLVADPKEVERARALAEELFREYGPIPFGTMVETPRAALLAAEIAPLVDFFSFGTNDLTQMAFGLSRDDAGKFLPRYVEEGLFPFDPTERLDEKGVGRLLRMAAEEGRKANPRLKLGLCGEHGGGGKRPLRGGPLGLHLGEPLPGPHRPPRRRPGGAFPGPKARLEPHHHLPRVPPVQEGPEGGLRLGEGEDGAHHGPKLPPEPGEEEAQGLLHQGALPQEGVSQKPRTARLRRMRRRGGMGATSPSAAPM